MDSDRRARYLLASFLLVLVLAPLLSGGVGLLVDWIWFGEQGFRVIYMTILKAQIKLSGLAGMGFIVTVGLNLLVARSLAHRYAYGTYGETNEFQAFDRFRSLFRGLIWVGILLAGYVLGQWGAAHWRELLLAPHPVVMHKADPLFGIDLGFYLFQLPFYL